MSKSRPPETPEGPREAPSLGPREGPPPGGPQGLGRVFFAIANFNES